MTDENLALLEQVTYIDKNVLDAAGIDMDLLPMDKGDTLEEVLEVFDEDAIKNLRDQGDTVIEGALQSGNEWADIIEKLKANPELMNLEVVKSEATVAGTANLNVCYENPATGQGIITYKGTSGYEEWYDNTLGLTQTETPLQQDALRFYNECAQQFDDMIVTGHSKGGNKAMYVTIAAEDDKISQCVAFDGQGFSNEFHEYYADRIAERSGKITNCAISTDFVHGLMKPIPDINWQFFQGFGMSSGAEYHSPNSFFQTDENGIITSASGEPQFVGAEENESIKHINGFTTFIMDNYSKEDLQEAASFLGNLTGYACGQGDYGKALNYLVSNPETLSKVKGMVMDYGKANNLNEQDFDNFVTTFFPDQEMAEKVQTICHYVKNKDNLIDGGLKFLVGYNEGGLEGAPEMIDGASEVIGVGLEDLGAGLGEKIDEIGEKIGDKIDEGGENLSSKINEGSDSIGDWLEETGESIGGPFDELGDLLGGAVRIGGDILGGVTEIGGQALGGIAETAGDVLGGIAEIGGDAAGAITKFGGDFISNTVDKAKDVFNGAKDVFNGVKEAFSDVGSFIGEKIFGKTPATKETAENTPAPSVEQSNGQSTTEAAQGQSQEEKGISGAAAGAVAGAVASAGAATAGVVGAAAAEAAKKAAEAVNAAKESHALNEVEDQYSYPTGQTMEDVLSGLSAEGNIVIINPVIINGQVEGSTIAPSYNAGSHAEDPYVVPLDAKKILDVDPLAMEMKRPVSKEDIAGVLSSEGGDIALIGDIAALFGALSEQENQLSLSEIAENWHQSHPIDFQSYLDGKENTMGDMNERISGALQKFLEGQGGIETGILPAAGIQNVLPFDSNYTPYNFTSTEYKSIIMPEADNQMQATRRMAAHC
ncbi:Protein of unknown function [Pseudobutyrivibrio sp. NOR37]|uniref:DUF2974 domain-containing protein n=1 Tax=Pseudobutyrivibrio xylanivorans TaxID=185007 RepID=A0A6M0LNF1_PSEXY|nr:MULTISPECIES: Mbeg1-like protein [Pseudobutyrivibrio]NEX02351.1 DUF2974 domain-containing protein [Pseudobutyrivibrio xylanivorans]SFR78411.1 Protein of unknown function [Pseudobutyrivibrio sp. NOR37]